MYKQAEPQKNEQQPDQQADSGQTKSAEETIEEDPHK